jgi:hypothetical protein
MYTYAGDSNLDGKINVDDYIRIDNGISSGLTGWSNGDFNYDGHVNIDDYTVIDSNVATQGAPFATSGGVAGGSASSFVTAVPEPAVLLPTFVAASPLLLRRRRRGRRGSPSDAIR